MRLPGNYKNYLISLNLGFLLTTGLSSIAQNQELSLKIAFYNVENLFHPEKDSVSNDGEFTPEGSRHWTFFRYHSKLNRIAKVIIALGKWEELEIIGLAEIENESVLHDLISSTVLKKLNYSYLHFQSPDKRGIDLALLYQSDKAQLIKGSKLRVIDSLNPSFRTRDMIYAKFLLNSNDSINLFYCHWPSRYGGQAQSEPKRLLCASILRNCIDSIVSNNPEAHIIIMGDFNDEPANASLQLLKGGHSENSLVNLMQDLKPNEGSHKYQGKWSYLDQIVVSQGLVDDNSRVQIKNQDHVFRESFLLEEDEKFPLYKPYRTFLGFKHHGGFSDHLPIYIELIINKAVD